MKKIFGITGPSVFTENIRSMVTDVFDGIALDINQNGQEDIKQIFDLCDVIILGGGSDIYPTTLEGRKKGEKRELERGNGYTKFDPKRDRRELELIRLCELTNKKYLGICRGHQIILSQSGLYLIPDISYSTVVHSPREIETQGEPVHYVRGIGNGVHEFFEDELTNSWHHQGILYHPRLDYKQYGIEVLGVANTLYDDGANKEQRIIELARGKNFLSIQWHPEVDYDTNLASQVVLEKFKTSLK